jgi:hypothetical protein
VGGRRLVGDDDEAERRVVRPNPDEGRKECLLVGRPGRPRDERRTTPSQRSEEWRGPVDVGGPLPDLIVARIAGDANDTRPHAERDQPPSVSLVDRADGVERRVGVGEQHPTEGAPTPGAFGEGRADQPQLHPAGRGGADEIRPDVELGEHQRRGPERVEGPFGGGNGVEWEVIGEIGADAGGESFGAGGEMRVGDLDPRIFGADELEHRSSLEALTNRGSVKPEKRASRLPVGVTPGAKAVEHAPPRTKSAQQLPLARRRDLSERRHDPPGARIRRLEERMHAGG